MNKMIQLFLLFNLVFANAQIHRFYYQLNYKPDKDSAKIVEKLTVLDISKNESLYATYEQIERDSLLIDGIKKMQKTGLHFDMSNFFNAPTLSSRIIKNGNKITFKDRIEPLSCQYEENLNLPWKIEQEKTKINSYDTQKATLNFGGRVWEAWFTTEIPIQDGPYKFFGLPGLIIKIEDEAQNFSWKLIGNKKYHSEAGLEKYDYYESQENGNKLPIFPKKKCLSILDDVRKNYFSNIMQMFDNPDAQLIQSLREDHKRMQKIFDENDNKIELIQ